MSGPYGLWISRAPEALALPNFVAAFEIVYRPHPVSQVVYIKQFAYTHWNKNSVPGVRLFTNTTHYKCYFTVAVYAEYYFSKEKILDKKITDNSPNSPKFSPSKILYCTVYVFAADE